MKTWKFDQTDTREVVFRGDKYLLIGNKINGWAMATKEQYENCLTSSAYVYPSGEIVQYGIVIGHEKELKKAKK